MWVPRVRVHSQVADMAVREVDVEQIEMALQEAGVFEPANVINYKSNGAMAGMMSVRKVLIVLSPDEQMLGKTFGAGETSPYQSWGVSYTPTDEEGIADITLYLYVKPEIVASEEPSKLATRYQGILLRSIWDLTHPKQPQHKELARFEGMSEYVRGKIEEMWWEVKK